jgi:hypothetical protein
MDIEPRPIAGWLSGRSHPHEGLSVEPTKGTFPR